MSLPTGKGWVYTFNKVRGRRVLSVLRDDEVTGAHKYHTFMVATENPYSNSCRHLHHAFSADRCLDVENRTWHEVPRDQGVQPCARSNHSMCRAGQYLVS